MVEQVWKNVFGRMFDYSCEDEVIRFRLPIGHSMTLYSFSRLIEQMEKALNKSAKIEMHLEGGDMAVQVQFDAEYVGEISPESPLWEGKEEKVEEPVDVESKEVKPRKTKKSSNE